LYSALPKEVKTEVRKGREKKRMKAKIGAIFLVSVLAIAGAGAAYALWFEDLYIYTDIYTGTVDVEWSYGGWGCDQTKDVSIGGGGIDGNLYLWVENAYPCVTYWWYFDIHCVGSIPVHFTPLNVFQTTVDPDWIEDFEMYIYGITLADGTYIEFDVPVPLAQLQLHTGETAWGYYELHFNNDLPQDSWFYMDFMTTAYQYNEDDYWE
jgi:hypothetical protein